MVSISEICRCVSALRRAQMEEEKNGEKKNKEGRGWMMVEGMRNLVAKRLLTCYLVFCSATGK